MSKSLELGGAHCAGTGVCCGGTGRILISRAVVVIVIVVIVAIEGSRSRAAVRLNYKPEPAAPYRKQLNDIQETPTIKKNTPDELTLQTHPPPNTLYSIIFLLSRHSFHDALRITDA